MYFLKKSFLLALVLFSTLFANSFADTASLLVLHTNDIHDYIKPGPQNVGGVPYLAGYVAAQRAERGDVLLLDGGDIMEKGDMVAYKTKSRITFEAMGRMGYTAAAVGNHDKVHGPEHLRECAALAGMAMLSLNYRDETGALHFPASVTTEINDIKIGIIGMSRIRTNLEKEGEHLARLARELDEQVHLLIVVAHIGTGELRRLSHMAPEVDLFIGGHTHEVLQDPVVVPETNALIVQAGQYAQYMGHLALAVDRTQKNIVWHEGQVVLMCHDTIEPDTEMLAWVHEIEQEYCPEAVELVGEAGRFINSAEIGCLAAHALKTHGDVDVGFCHPGQVIRSGIYEGPVDVNMLFRTGGQRGRNLLLFDLTGRQLEAYVAGLIQERRGRTEWAGFGMTPEYDAETRRWSATTTLEPDTTYRVIMTEREYDHRFLRVVQGHPDFEDFDKTAATQAPFTFTQALTAYVRDISEQGETLDAHIESLQEKREQ